MTKKITSAFFSVVFIFPFFSLGIALATHTSEDPKICHSSLQDCNRKLGDDPPPPQCPVGEQCIYDGGKYFCVDQSYKSPLTGKNSVYKNATDQCKRDIEKFSVNCQGICSEDPRYSGTYDKCRYPNDPTNQPLETYSQLIERRKKASCIKITIKPPPPPPPPPPQCERRLVWKCRDIFDRNKDQILSKKECEKNPKTPVAGKCAFSDRICVITKICSSAKRGWGAINGLFGGGFLEQRGVDPCERNQPRDDQSSNGGGSFSEARTQGAPEKIVCANGICVTN